jgi:hypothetical protein
MAGYFHAVFAGVRMWGAKDSRKRFIDNGIVAQAYLSEVNGIGWTVGKAFPRRGVKDFIGNGYTTLARQTDDGYSSRARGS